MALELALESVGYRYRGGHEAVAGVGLTMAPGIVGLLGSLLGSALAWSFLAIWRMLALNPDGTPMFMIDVEPELIVIAAGGATLVGILAALMPARRAANLDPVVAIRG